MGLLNIILKKRTNEPGQEISNGMTSVQSESFSNAPINRFFPRKANSLSRRSGGGNPSPNRRCRFEEMEKREMLAVDFAAVDFGAVYVEQGMTTDLENVGDAYYVSWQGGEKGTALDRLTIDISSASQQGLYFDFGNGNGAYGGAIFSVVDNQTTDSISYTVSVFDGGQSLLLDFDNFYSGDVFVFTIDTDEIASPDNAIVEGGEFEGATISASFVSPHFETASATVTYKDTYRLPEAFRNADDASNPYLPPDELVVGNGSIQTAGAFTNLNPPDPKPLEISGYVYEDRDMDNQMDSNEKGIEGEILTLLVQNEDGNWDSTGQTQTTDSNGFYKFDSNDLKPGVYSVVDSANLEKYLDFGASAGHIVDDGRTEGIAVSNLKIAGIDINGGEESVRNDFGKIVLGSISGNVYEDRNNNGVLDSGENGIGSALVELLVWNDDAQKYDSVSIIQTESDGTYYFGDLMIGKNYAVRETTPSPYIDGLDAVGTIDGQTVGEPTANDFITGIQIGWDDHGVRYDFGELMAGSLAGSVYYDVNNNAQRDSNEVGIPNTRVELYVLDDAGNYVACKDADGNAIYQETDSEGRYLFSNLNPFKTYGIKEIQPSDYVDGQEHIGTLKGTVSQNDFFTGIFVGWDEHGREYDFGELKVASLSGYVYEDLNDNGLKESGEQGISGVSLSLYVYNETTGLYETAVDVDGNARITETNSQGFYLFDNLEPFRMYKVVETQPEEYFDGKDSIGTVDGTAVGTFDPLFNDVLSDVELKSESEGINYNFGELKGASLSGFVYEDNNDNGLMENGEKGIAGVSLLLYVLNETTGQYEAVLNADGSSRTEATKSDGSYLFENLAPNKTYKVVELQPEDYFDGQDSVGTVDGLKVGILSANDECSEVVLGGWDDGVQYNFGELKGASLSGFVYEDNNDDGLRDSNEKGIADATLILSVYNESTGVYETAVDKSGNALTAKTNENGAYLFENLAPNQKYRVSEIQPEGYFDGQDTIGTVDGLPVGIAFANDVLSEINLGGWDSGIEYNFGELKGASISGFVYEDNNDNGIKETGEAGIQGVSLSLLVYNELTGVYEAVKNEDGTLRTTITDENGAYKFAHLQPNRKYQVVETQPEDYFDGQDTVGTIDGQKVGEFSANDILSSIAVAPWDEGIDYNFGELKGASISGFVYEDNNDDGNRDENENGIAGVVLSLYVFDEVQGDYVPAYDNTGKIRTETTASDGSYRFENLTPGLKYRVVEAQPEDYFDGKDSVGTIDGQSVGERGGNDVLTNIDVAAWDEGIEYNFGELKPSALSGYVYEDLNDNGVKENGENGIQGVELQLWVLSEQTGEYERALDSDGTIRTAITDSTGFYRFDRLNANSVYKLVEIQPDDYQDGQDAVGSFGGNWVQSDIMDSIHPRIGEEGTHYDFGEIRPGTISGYVYEDNNNNGLKESGEAGISGVTVRLYTVDSDGTRTLAATKTTDKNGYYIFNKVYAGLTYVIRETQPAGYTDGLEAVGSQGGKIDAATRNDEIFDVSIKYCENGINNNFGELKNGSLSGYVYEDKNDNGYKETSEPGISDVSVELWKYNETSKKYVYVRNTQTNESGYYEFNDLEPLTRYRLVETQPAKYNDGKDRAGTLGGSVANDDISTIDLGVGENGINYLFGEKLPTPPDDDIPGTGTTPPSIQLAYHPGINGASPFYYNFVHPVSSPSRLMMYGGGGAPAEYSWHLSVINGGYPRALEAQTSTAGFRAVYQNLSFRNVSWSGEQSWDQGQWLLRDQNGTALGPYIFGANEGRPVAGDWNGDGVDEIGLYVNGDWFLDLMGEYKWTSNGLWAKLGDNHDQPVVGDWDGDGKTDIGIFGVEWAGDALAASVEPGLPTALNLATDAARPKNLPPDPAESVLNVRPLRHTVGGNVRADLIDHIFRYGSDGDLAFAGDFTGDGVANVGVYRKGEWFIDMNGNGRWDEKDLLIESGLASVDADNAIPVIGDWDGNGIDDIGLFEDGNWYLDSDHDFRFDTTVSFGQKGDIPVVGDWNGDGIDQLGVYRPSAQVSTSNQEVLEVRNDSQNSSDASETVAQSDLPTNLR